MADDGGLARLQRRLAAIPREVKKAVQPTLMKEAGIIADTMAIFAPDDPATNAPDLKSSIAVTGPGKQTPAYSQPGGSMVVPENAVAITVGDTDVRYPHLQEYGTKHHPAQPFFWPSVRLHRKKATNNIKNAIRRAVRKAR
jgi:HK97 gp10 family phage protein